MDTSAKKLARCAIYTRKSTEHNLHLEFNYLDAQREACEAYMESQAHEGWHLIPGHYDDGAFSGASLDHSAPAEAPYRSPRQRHRHHRGLQGRSAHSIACR